MKLDRLVVLLVAIYFVLSGCGSGPTIFPPIGMPLVSPTASPPSTPPIEATLNTTRFAFAPTWVPVSFNPQVVEGESVSRVDEWPTNGATVKIVCRLEGGEFLNPISANMETSWYRVVVPADKADGAAQSRAVKTPDGYLGYMQAFWLIPTREVSNCSP